MRAVELTFVAGWIAFWLYWMVSATSAKPGRSQWTRFAGIRIAIILVALLLIRLRVLRGHSLIHDPVLWGVGLGLWVLGLGLAIWARVYLGRNWGMPMSTKADPELVTTGPYSRVRHPIYTGLILGLIGTAIGISFYWLIADAVLGAYFVYSATVEERNLAKLFPETYPEYKRATKMLIPFVF
jgi:protein-S-isoprenylcysteine O-methyltransferase Ste14